MTSPYFWSRIIHVTSHRTLLDAGYLCPLEYVHEPLMPYEAIPVNISHSDFNLESYSQMVIGMESQILNTIAEAQRRYKSVLVFCAETEQAIRLSMIVKNSRWVLGSTGKKLRSETIEKFKDGSVQTVFNVGCLTVGFDHPGLDCVILLRPVRSPILYLQMLGRGTRPAPGKEKCTVIDLTGSCKALGAVESFEMFLNRGLWDVRSEKVDGFHGKLLFKMKI
jgi:DNA repair protein RadD